MHFLLKRNITWQLLKRLEEQKICRKESSKSSNGFEATDCDSLNFFHVVGRTLVKQRSLFSWHGRPYVFRLRRFKQNTKGGRQVVFGLKYQASSIDYRRTILLFSKILNHDFTLKNRSRASKLSGSLFKRSWLNSEINPQTGDKNSTILRNWKFMQVTHYMLRQRKK